MNPYHEAWMLKVYTLALDRRAFFARAFPCDASESVAEVQIVSIPWDKIPDSYELAAGVLCHALQKVCSRSTPLELRSLPNREQLFRFIAIDTRMRSLRLRRTACQRVLIPLLHPATLKCPRDIRVLIAQTIWVTRKQQEWEERETK